MEIITKLLDAFPAANWVLLWNIGASIGTLVLALLTFFMVLEMRWARLKDVFPELILLPPVYRYNFWWVPERNLQPIITPELKKNESNRYETRLPVFGLKNIGSSTALDVSLDWWIDTDTKIPELIKKRHLQAYSAAIMGELVHIEKKHDGGSSGYGSKCLLQESDSFPYCVASPKDDFLQPASLPTGVCGAYELFLIEKQRPAGLLGVNFIKVEDIIVEIKYRNLDNKEFRRAFRVTSELMYLADSVGSPDNEVEPAFYSEHNMRGSIHFHVEALKKGIMPNKKYERD
jgi:hypothetical protein